MIPLSERLGTLDSGTVYNIYALWFDHPQTGGKAACIAALVPVLENTERIYSRVRAWDEDLRRALALTRAHGVGRYGDLLAACAAGGLGDGETMLRRLFERGLLLPVAQEVGSRVDSAALAKRWDREIGIVPAVGHVPGGSSATLRPRTLIPDRVACTRLADASVLAGSLVRLAALCGRRSLRQNRDGLPGGRLMAAVTKEVGEGGWSGRHPSERAWRPRGRGPAHGAPKPWFEMIFIKRTALES